MDYFSIATMDYFSIGINNVIRSLTDNCNVVYGIIMTLVPLLIGFLFAKYVLKLSLLNNLGSITGGMTSTPALGTLIGTAGTEDVAAAYAATYPIALIAVVLVSQFLIILF